MKMKLQSSGCKKKQLVCINRVNLFIYIYKKKHFTQNTAYLLNHIYVHFLSLQKDSTSAYIEKTFPYTLPISKEHHV